jgi:hypothetical protein
MTASEITREAIAKGLIYSTGLTPNKSMAARLYVLSRTDSNAGIVRLFEPGDGRARRGSVRWVMRNR